MAKKAVVMDSCNCGNGCKCNSFKVHQCGGSGAIYGLGFLGAAIYYISTATGFWMGVLGVLKALIWPVFLVYHTLGFIGA